MSNKTRLETLCYTDNYSLYRYEDIIKNRVPIFVIHLNRVFQATLTCVKIYETGRKFVVFIPKVSVSAEVKYFGFGIEDLQEKLKEDFNKE